MPVTRRSHANSQSQSSLIPPANSSQPNETFTSVSTATLPPRYKITLAVGASDLPLSKETRDEAYIRGEEVLSDGWRRDIDVEGRLADLRKRAVGSGPDDGKVLWYTAGLHFPCTCQLDRNRSWTPTLLPPLPKTISDSDFPPSTLPHVRIGESIPEWSKDLLTDLDPTLSDLEDFSIDWQGVTGNLWKRIHPVVGVVETPDDETSLEEREARRRRKGKMRAVDPGAGVARVAPPVQVALLEGRAVAEVWVPRDPGPVRLEAVPVKGKGELSWEEEAKRRKAYWRQLVSSDSQYGKIWSIIPHPHKLEPLLLPFPLKPIPKLKPDVNPKPDSRPPDYILPRILTSPAIQHPYHPNLASYIKSNPQSRVHWVIPIHGPVLIPHLNHPIHNHLSLANNDNITSNKVAKANGSAAIPVPSPAILSPDIDTNTTIPERITKPATLHWTPNLLHHFYTSFLQPLHKLHHNTNNNSFGPISIRCSGPKPDPFLSLRPSIPLTHHVGVSGSGNAVDSRTRLPPQRVECGVHIRVYVDARMALGLRTWLNGVEVDLEGLGEGVARDRGEGGGGGKGHGGGDQGRGQGKDQGQGRARARGDQGQRKDPGHGQGQAREGDSERRGEKDPGQGRVLRPLHKVRLALVGERGEVLVVA